MIRPSKNFKSEKGFSEEELRELIDARIAEERTRREKDESFSGTVNGESDFDAERERYMSEKLEFETAKLLMRANLPLSFAHILAGDDEEECAENVRIFKSEFSKAIEADLNTRLRGKTPLTSSVVENNDPFLKGFGN